MGNFTKSVSLHGTIKRKRNTQPSTSASEECSYLRFPQYSGTDFCSIQMFPYTAIRVKNKRRAGTVDKTVRY